MKKILSTLLVAVMLLSLAALAMIPVAAVDGDWIVYSKAEFHLEGFEGDMMSIPGYEYTEEGLKVIGADWRDFAPGAGVQTKEKVDLKKGVYMEVRVDEFTNENDFWFNFNIWSQPYFKAGQTNTEKWGYGVQELIRSNKDYSSFSLQWRTNGWDAKGDTKIDAKNTPLGKDGCLYFTFVVTWDGSTYTVSINGSVAPKGVSDYMNKTYATDSEAYIGFNFQNSNKNGKCACTVLNFGTNKNDAAAPLGDDSRAPENFYLTIAEIANPDTVEAGQPAIFMNGNRAESDIKMVPGFSNGTRTVNEDYSLHCVAAAAGPYVIMNTANDVSYAIEDFPVAMFVTRDFCTCGSDECYALESTHIYMMTGEAISPGSGCRVENPPMCESPYVIDGHSYLYFFCDFSDERIVSAEQTGRINGVRLDFMGIDAGTAGKNAFDLCFAAMFRTVEEAQAYAKAYFAELGYVETEEPTTEAPTEEPTEAPTEEPTADATTEANADVVTEAPNGNETEAPAKSGCGSAIGFSAIAIVATVAVAGVVSFKKKD